MREHDQWRGVCLCQNPLDCVCSLRQECNRRLDEYWPRSAEAGQSGTKTWEESEDSGLGGEWHGLTQHKWAGSTVVSCVWMRGEPGTPNCTKVPCPRREYFKGTSQEPTLRSLPNISQHLQDFPGGPVAKTPCSQCRGLQSNPWSRNWIPHATTKKTLHATMKIKGSECYN